MEWNETLREYPEEKCVHELFEEQVEKSPEAVAVVFEDRQLSYQELNKRANRLAHSLQRLGVGPEARVGICVERSLEMVVGLLGILKAGGAYVPLDPNYPKARLLWMLEDSGPRVVVTKLELVKQLPEHNTPVVCLDGDWEKIGRSSEENPMSGVSGDNVAYVIYTSGSTGRPKGVLGLQRGAVNRCRWMWERYPFLEQEVCCQKTSLNFIDSMWEIFGPLLRGVRIVAVSEPVTKDPVKLTQLLNEQEVTRLVLVPSLLKMLLEHCRSQKVSVGVKLWVSSGERLSGESVRSFEEIVPWGRLLNLYGSSEVSADVSWSEVEQSMEAGGVVTIGRPIANTRLYVLDRNLQPVPVGVTGELYAGGEGLARGYLKGAELTAERFIPDPYGREQGKRVYKTGDLSRYLTNGELEFLGRADYQVKTHGVRIELGEIEAALLEHPGVHQAVVVAREQDSGERQLVAYCVGVEGEELGIEDLRHQVKKRLPEYMAPAAYVRLERLPLTPNGKLDRRALPAPEGDDYLRRSYEPPEGETETRLAQIWAELLKVERVSRHDNFFELGGHSLLAVRALSRLRQALGAEVSLPAFFARPVLADFALTVGRASQTELPPITCVDRHQPMELSFAQQRLWFLAQFEGASEAYHIAGGLRLVGDLDRAALRRALDRIVARHEALRTTFSQIDGRPVQVIGPAEAGFLLAEEDLRHEAEPQAALRRLVAEEARRPFDLGAGPLIRGRLARLGDEEHALLVTMHHIVSDGWSMGILVNELSRLYRSYSQGQADPLPDLPVQYADYAAWQRAMVERSGVGGAGGLLEAGAGGSARAAGTAH